MDLSKSYEFFQPEMCKERIHIIGCGSVGSTLAELLARFGLTNISLYDFDIVEPHNLANQMFVLSDVGKAKVDAVAERMEAINPLVKTDVRKFPEGWKPGTRLTGYIFLAVDNIELRHKIVKENMYNPFIKGMFDFRTRLVDAQHYAADWSIQRHKDAFIRSMEFTHAEAKEATPVSACNVALSVAPTVWHVCLAGVCNFVNFVKGEALKKIVLVNPFSGTVDTI
jgi:adenylyltransferase/sulfurtransferase